jgi:hypothetical protein
VRRGAIHRRRIDRRHIFLQNQAKAPFSHP